MIYEVVSKLCGKLIKMFEVNVSLIYHMTCADTCSLYAIVNCVSTTSRQHWYITIIFFSTLIF